MSPARSNLSETSNTLRYAARAKRIKTKPIVVMVSSREQGFNKSCVFDEKLNRVLFLHVSLSVCAMYCHVCDPELSVIGQTKFNGNM